MSRPSGPLAYAHAVADLTFDLEYDGPALDAHEMDVRELAPALISTADLFQELNRLLYPTAPPLAVNVRATTEGSFLVQLKMVYDSTVATLTSDDTTATVNLLAMLTAVGTLVNLIRRRFRDEPVAQEELPDQPGIFRFTWADGATLEIPLDVLRASENVTIRRSIADVVRPVGRPGVDVVRLRQDTITIAEVRKADAAAFEAPPAPPDREVIHSGERDAYLTIHTAGFETNRWRFSDGQSLMWAPIRDEVFVRELDAGTRRVGKLDVLHCRITEEQWRDTSGFHSEVEVTEVLEVLPYEPPVQGTLNIEGLDEEA